MPLRGHCVMESDSIACRDGNGVDRISQLPDQILLHILSSPSLTTRDVVRNTATLSKRWKSLWASLPVLSFEPFQFSDQEEEEEEEDEVENYRCWGRFERFVNAVLVLRDWSDVHKFCLKWICEFPIRHPDSLATWIRYAVSHNVKWLDIELCLDGYHFALPRCLFDCQHLTGMRLEFIGGNVDITPPKCMRLARLRNLLLSSITISCGLLQNLVSGCPVLEDLQLLGCRLTSPVIYSNTLKKLSIELCNIEGTVVRISSPSLLYLRFEDNAFSKVQVLLEDLSSLVKASFQTDGYPGYNVAGAVAEIIEFIEAIPGKDVFGDKTFHNLMELELTGENMAKNFQAVVHLLRRSPNLEKLILGNDEPSHRTVLRRSFDCPHLHIKIQLQCGKQNENLIELLTQELLSDSNCDCGQE